MPFFFLFQYPNGIRYIKQIHTTDKNVGIWPISIHTFWKYICLACTIYLFGLMSSIDSETMRIWDKNKTSKPEAFWRRQIINYKFGCFTEKSFFSHFSLSFWMVATAYKDEINTERMAIKTILHGKINGKLHRMKNEMPAIEEIMSSRNCLVTDKDGTQKNTKKKDEKYEKMNRIRAM